jgi:hypothetical protein
MQYPKASPASKKSLAAQVEPSLVYHIGCSLRSLEGYGYRRSSSHGNWHPGHRDGFGTGTLGKAADDELFLPVDELVSGKKDEQTQGHGGLGCIPWHKHAIDPLYAEADLSIAFQ